MWKSLLRTFCISLLGIGAISPLASMKSAVARSADTADSAAADEAFADDSNRASDVQQAGWWKHSSAASDNGADPCDGTAGEYCLPGNPNAPVIIDGGQCPPGVMTIPGVVAQPGCFAPPNFAAPPAIGLPGAPQCQPLFPGGPILGPPLFGRPYPPAPASTDPLLPYAKNGILQQVDVNATYLPRLGGGGLGFIDVVDYSTYALPVPLPGEKSFLVVTPEGQVHFVDGPDAEPLPHHLYDSSVLIQLAGQLPDNVLFDIGAEPGYHTDLKNHSSDAWQTSLYAAIGYRFSQTFAIGAGVGYLDRRDIGLVPLVGLIWVPNPDTRFELIPPKPRFERRICAGMGYDDWFYIGGELGGGQWAIERADGTHDVVSYRDWRALMGVERRSYCGGLGGLAEVGYVFGRRLEFGGGEPNYDPPDTWMVRVGLIY